MKVAVVGGGVFGTTAAVYAAREGHEVHLFERENSLLSAASGINQYRLHRGYHYPRSFDTARSALNAEKSFREEYGPAVMDGGRHIYAIAREGSLTSADEFFKFCNDNGLQYQEIDPSEIINREKVECAVEVPETWYDPHILLELVLQKLRDAGVEILLRTHATKEALNDYDAVIFAAYALHNDNALHLPRREHQYEICEKPVISLPENFGLTGVVVLDGPFMCVDPMGRSGNYVMGNVVHAIHAANTGLSPEVPAALKHYLNRGVIKNPEVTRFREFIENGSEYIPMLKDARHVGSMYTIRTVLPRLESTDARPTEVRRLDARHIKIFSGKVGNCVEAARRASKMLKEKFVDAQNAGAKVAA